MSIYGTLWTMHFPVDGSGGMTMKPGQEPYSEHDGFAIWKLDGSPDFFAELTAQAVPGHIDYTGPAWEWLPPPAPDQDTLRAVFIIGPKTLKGSDRCGQEYLNPVLVLTGEEYRRIGWRDLWGRIAEALPAHLTRPMEREDYPPQPYHLARRKNP